MTIEPHSLSSLNEQLQSESGAFPVFTSLNAQATGEQRSNLSDVTSGSETDSYLNSSNDLLKHCNGTTEAYSHDLGQTRIDAASLDNALDGITAHVGAICGSDTRHSLDDYKCPICLDILINTVKVDCSYGHKFCNFCISSWIAVSRHLVTECPVCRGAIFGKTLDLKTDAEIRSIFELLPETEKTARLLSIKERLQVDYPITSSCLPELEPSDYIETNYESAANEEPISHYPFRQNYFQQAYQHHNHHFHYHLPPVAENGVGEGHASRYFHVAHQPTEINSTGSDPNPVANGTSQDFQPAQSSTGNGEVQHLWIPPQPQTLSDSGINSTQDNAAIPTPATTERGPPAGTEAQYQHFRYQNHQSSLWNTNFYLTPEDNSNNEAATWSPNTAPDDHNSNGSANGGRCPQYLAPGGATYGANFNSNSNASYGPEAPQQNPPSNEFAWFGHHHHHGTSNQPGPAVYQANPHHVAQHHHHQPHIHAENWRYHQQHHPSSLTPVLFPSPPVMPTPVHFATSCAVAHCYFAPCPIHGVSGPHHNLGSGLVHLNCGRNPYGHVEAMPLRQNSATMNMRQNMAGQSSSQLTNPASSQRPRTTSSLPSSPTAGSPRSRMNDEDRRRRRQYQRNVSNNFGGLSPRSYGTPTNGNEFGSRISSRVASCPVLSRGSHFSGGFSLFSRGYVGFQITHLPAHDRRIVAPPGRITHPLVSLTPLASDGSSARVTLTFDVHRV